MEQKRRSFSAGEVIIAFLIIIIRVNAEVNDGNHLIKNQEQCDCLKIFDVMRLHSDRLSELVTYERHTRRLLEWQKTLPSNHQAPAEEQGEDWKDEIRNYTSNWQEAASLLVEKRVKEEVENQSLVLQNTIESLESKMEDLTRLVMDMSHKNALPPTRRPQQQKKTPEQVILEQMSLMLSNLTQEVTLLRSHRLPELESRIALVEKVVTSPPDDENLIEKLSSSSRLKLRRARVPKH